LKQFKSNSIISFLSHFLDFDMHGNEKFNCILCFLVFIGYNYAGLQFGEECWCSNNYGKHQSISKDRCNYQCPGNISATCGGFNSLDVYQTGYGSTIFLPILI